MPATTTTPLNARCASSHSTVSLIHGTIHATALKASWKCDRLRIVVDPLIAQHITSKAVSAVQPTGSFHIPKLHRSMYVYARLTTTSTMAHATAYLLPHLPRTMNQSSSTTVNCVQLDVSVIKLDARIAKAAFIGPFWTRVDLICASVRAHMSKSMGLAEFTMVARSLYYQEQKDSAAMVPVCVMKQPIMFGSANPLIPTLTGFASALHPC